MKRGIFTILFCFSVGLIFGQTRFRSNVVSGNWEVPGSWQSKTGAGTWVAAVTAPSIAADTITIRNGHTITVNATIDIDQTVIQLGATLIVSGNVPLTQLRVIANASVGPDLAVNGILQINNGATVRTHGTVSLLQVNSTGTINNGGSITNPSTVRLVFSANAVYNHENPEPGQIPVANWNVDSFCRITGNVQDKPTQLNQTGGFGNFEWNTPTLTDDVDLDGDLRLVRGNLTFTNTGGSRVYLTQGTTLNLAVNGDLNYAAAGWGGFTLENPVNINVGGDFNYQSTSFVSTDVGTVGLTVAGNVNLTSGIFDASTLTGTTNISIAGDYTRTTTNIVNSGTGDLNLIFNGTGDQIFTSTFIPLFAIDYSTTNTSNLIIAESSFLAGPGNLNLGDGTFLSLLSEEPTGAIQEGAGAGNVQVTGTRTYDGTIVYNGTAAQFMSGEHPGSANTRIDNSSAEGVEMLDDVEFTGALELTLGVLKIENYTLTIGGDYIWPNLGGFLGIAPLSNIVINGSGAFDEFVLSPYAFPNNPMRDLTIDRDETITQGDFILTIAGAFTQTLGDYSFSTTGTPNLRIGGTISQVSGTSIIGESNATLAFLGQNLPPTIHVSGTLDSLTMARNGADIFIPSEDFSVKYLNLYNGDVDPSGLIEMVTEGVVTRVRGNLISPLEAEDTYDVLYASFGPLATGPELYPNTGDLNNLTLDNPFNFPLLPQVVTLGAPVFVNGSFTVTEGTFITSSYAMNIGGDLSVTTNGTFQPGTSTMTFDGGAAQTISSVDLLTLDSVIVDQSPAATVTLLSGMNIQSSFGVISASAVDVGNQFLTLLSTPAKTAHVPELDPVASIVGSVIVQRQLPNTAGDRAYRYLAPPAATTVADWQAEFAITGPFTGASTGPGIVSANPSLYRYDETLATTTLESGYENWPPTGGTTAAVLEVGRGYAAFLRTEDPYDYDTRGTLGQQDVPVSITNSGNGVISGFNLIGNPYPAPIFWDDVILDVSGSVDDAIYFTDNTLNSDGSTRKVAYAGGVATSGEFNGVIAQGQGFWVHTPSNGTINFAEAHKDARQAQFLREGDIMNLLRIKLKNQNTTDQIVIRLHEDATDEFDGKYDAYTFLASGLHISSLSKNNLKLAINSISSKACDRTVPLQIDGGVKGNYILDFTGMETFDPDVTLYLNDKVQNTQVALATTPQYAFTVTDVAKLKDRFELFVDRPSVETALAVAGESTCETSALAYITVQNSQANVLYTAQWNNQTVSGEVSGNGGTLQIPVNVENFTHGEHEIAIFGKISTCDPQPLTNKATLAVVKKGVIESVEDGSVCQSGPVLIKAKGLDAVLYNWYEDLGDANPIAGQNAAEFTTPVLTKTKTYYVAAVSTLGCEGDRVAVKATVTNLEEVTITAEGTMLTSSYPTGNQWYLDGVLIQDATTNQLEALLPGSYTVVATVDGCSSTSAAREMFVTGVAETLAGNFINIYPNPTTDQVSVNVKSDNNAIEARLMSPIGVELKGITLKGERGIQSGSFDLLELPTGMYMVRIQVGKKIYTKKISKIK